MNSTVFYRGYHVYSAIDAGNGSLHTLINKVLDNRINPQHVFKDNSRTYSALFEFDGQPFMLKIPRGRNRRTWERILTLFRTGEGVRTFKHLQLMQKLGLNAPLPIAAAEKRKYGFVVDGFACYQFEPGRPAEPQDAQRVTKALIQLHELGYLRTDPQASNFLVTERGIVFIDFRLKKPVIFPRFQKNLELSKLVRVYKPSEDFIPMAISESTLFKFALWLEAQTFQLDQKKRFLRQWFKRKFTQVL